MDPAVRIDIQEAISRFYTGRIGVRFLIEHHVSTLPPVRTGVRIGIRKRILVEISFTKGKGKGEKIARVFPELVGYIRFQAYVANEDFLY